MLVIFSDWSWKIVIKKYFGGVDKLIGLFPPLFRLLSTLLITDFNISTFRISLTVL